MFTKAGAQGNALLFILTDGQITDEKFLVYINDLLSSGYIPELFAKDELDGLLGKVRAEAKG
jgi:dynein heavy chain